MEQFVQNLVAEKARLKKLGSNHLLVFVEKMARAFLKPDLLKRKWGAFSGDALGGLKDEEQKYYHAWKESLHKKLTVTSYAHAMLLREYFYETQAYH